MASYIVLGMHRSGTSCLTGILQRLGVELGEVHTQNPFNARGNREHPRIMALNDTVLAYNGSAWDKPELVKEWLPAHSQERDAIVAALAADSYAWGFKDPRSLFTLPLWLEVMSPLAIGTFRDPRKVAASLQHRNRFSFDQSFALWEIYNRRLLSLATEHNFPLVDFDLGAADYLDDVLLKTEALGLSMATSDHAKVFYEAGLKNQDQKALSSMPLPSSTADLYSQLRTYHKNWRPNPAVLPRLSAA